MNPQRLIPLVALCLTLALAAVARVDEPANVLSADEKSAGWKLLFDGRSAADAWRAWDKDAFPAKGWVVEDGSLKCEKSNGRPNGGGGDLITRNQFTDFEFRWDWRISKGGNSGVKYLLGNARRPPNTLYNGDKGLDFYGHEYQLLDDDTHPDAKNGPIRMTASFYSVIAPNASKKLRPVGEFNESRLLIRGDHVEHWLNGAKVVEYDLGSPDVVAAIAKTKYKGLPGFCVKHKSALLLQDHGCEIWFRNLKIRDLAADVPGAK